MGLKTVIAWLRDLSTVTGTRHWWMQRLTAAVLVPLSLWFITSIISIMRADYRTVLDWIQTPSAWLLLLLFVVFTLYHAFLGVQVVVEDYIHTDQMKHSILATTQWLLLILGIAAGFALVVIAFRSA